MSDSDVDQLAHALAGAGGGILSIVVTYPLVTLTTLAQAQKSKAEDAESVVAEEMGRSRSVRTRLWSLMVGPQNLQSDSANTVPSNVEVLKKIVKQQGLKGLYNGLESAVIGNAATNFLYYYFYELTGKTLSRRGSRQNSGLSVTQSIAAGAVAGSISRVATNPIWVTNTRMTVLAKEQQDLKKLNTLQALVYLVKTEGVKGLFNGVVPSLLLVLNPIIQYTVFEQLKTLILKVRRRRVTALDALILGALGKLIATIITYPYITLRSRLHLSTETDEKNELKATYNLARSMLKEEGIASFYRGLSVKLTQSVAAAAFLFFFKQELVTSSDKLVKSVFRKKKLVPMAGLEEEAQ
ncbi:unnamed protein product [Kuraishia capsulata CBS 1993]|uniref:Peroxisomal membrane protein PMP47B n=1 Tax=Kuraishia capsulata CBS 1993 TaxID=1382522 RepID=W6MUM4_9ASCO|nr:uncharacterized protein KUCA_T00005390001 [Kuraishia capsulata CBS 1993]CDK29402.1 unnamed protein product [Kuraishia capsulata CBS 1993]